MKKEKPKHISGAVPLPPTLSDEQIKKILPTVTNGKAKEKKKKRKLGWRNRLRLRRHPEKAFLIRMMFSNGTSKEFVIVTNKETFTYMKRTYYLRYEDSWFNLTQSQYELNYFDDHPVPLDRSIIKQGDVAYWSVTSENLKPIIQMEYVKALASSADIDKWLKTSAIIGIILMMMMLVSYWFLFKIMKILQGG